MSKRSAIARLVVASKNPDKVKEIKSILVHHGLAGEIVAGMSWPDVDETETTIEGNALLKARTVAAATGLPALADDTGLEVAALGGEPGVHTARFAGPKASYEDNVEKLLALLDGVVDRRATFRSVVALVWPDGTEMIAEGRLEGRIASEPRGSLGFGYDPIFEVDGVTLSELDPEEKDGLSHRAMALRALSEVVRNVGRGGRPPV